MRSSMTPPPRHFADPAACRQPAASHNLTAYSCVPNRGLLPFEPDQSGVTPHQEQFPMSFVIVPSVDLRNGQVVRLKQGDYARQTTYDVDPLKTAQAFASAGAAWMHIVDLDGAKEGKPVQTELIT